MENNDADGRPAKKSVRQSSREMSTALFLLRCKQLGFTLADLDEMTIGMVIDVFTENANDSYEYDEIATEEDINSF